MQINSLHHPQKVVLCDMQNALTSQGLVKLTVAADQKLCMEGFHALYYSDSPTDMSKVIHRLLGLVNLRIDIKENKQTKKAAQQKLIF